MCYWATWPVSDDEIKPIKMPVQVGIVRYALPAAAANASFVASHLINESDTEYASKRRASGAKSADSYDVSNRSVSARRGAISA